MIFSSIAIGMLSVLIKMYQYTLSAVFPSSCRFYPSCSNYSLEAMEKHGLIKGVWLSSKRISKCHPFHDGGFDPVPNTEAVGELMLAGSEREDLDG